MRTIIHTRTGQFYERLIMQRRETIKRIINIVSRMQHSYNMCFGVRNARAILVQGGDTYLSTVQYVELRDQYERYVKQDLLSVELAHLIMAQVDTRKIQYLEMLLHGIVPQHSFGTKTLKHMRGWLISEVRVILQTCKINIKIGGKTR